MTASHLDSVIDRYIQGKASDKVRRNVEMFLKAMSDCDIFSFPADKEDLIFTILCCDDVIPETMKNIVVTHGENIPPGEDSFRTFRTRSRTPPKS